MDRRAALDLWKHTLGHIPSLFGKMIYLASLRDAKSGAFRHYGLEEIYGQRRVRQLLESTYIEMVQAWRALSTAQQDADLEHHVGSLQRTRLRQSQTGVPQS